MFDFFFGKSQGKSPVAAGNNFQHISYTNKLKKLLTIFSYNVNAQAIAETNMSESDSDSDSSVESIGEEAYMEAAMSMDINHTPITPQPGFDRKIQSAQANSEEGAWNVVRPKSSKKRDRSKSVIESEGIQVEKKSRKGSGEHNETNKPETIEKRNANNLTVVIKGLDGKNVCHLSPVKVTQTLHREVGDIEKVIKEKNQLRITCKNNKQLQSILNLTEIAGVPIIVVPYQKTIESKGVIHRVDIYITDSELNDLTKEQGVKNAIRFKKRIKGSLVPTPSVLLIFEGTSIPKEINILSEKFQIDKYIQPITRCFKCQRFGHVQKACPRNETRCVRCGKEHTYEECPTKDNPICMRCGGNHSAAFQGCEVYKKAKQIHAIKINNNLTYAQAAKKYHETNLPTKDEIERKEPQITQKSSIENRPIPPPNPNKIWGKRDIPENRDRSAKPVKMAKSIETQTEQLVVPEGNSKEQSNKGKETTDQKCLIDLNPSEELNPNEVGTPAVPPPMSHMNINFLSFITYLITYFDDKLTRPERIRLVVEAAQQCLDIQDVTSKMIFNRIANTLEFQF